MATAAKPGSMPKRAREKLAPAGLWRYAKEYAEAAQAVMQSQRHGQLLAPTYYLIGHSIELSLKAFLLRRGVSLETLARKPYSHSLENLLAECRRKRIGRLVKLSRMQDKAIRRFGLTGTVFRYLEIGTITAPRMDHLLSIASLLVIGLRAYCLGEARKSAARSTP